MNEDLHQTARDFMAKHSKADWELLSLDDWLIEYAEDLPIDVREEGAELLSMFSGYGGND